MAVLTRRCSIPLLVMSLLMLIGAFACCCCKEAFDAGSTQTPTAVPRPYEYTKPQPQPMSYRPPTYQSPPPAPAAPAMIPAAPVYMPDPEYYAPSAIEMQSYVQPQPADSGMVYVQAPTSSPYANQFGLYGGNY
jgi:hypothetical protein